MLTEVPSALADIDIRYQGPATPWQFGADRMFFRFSITAHTVAPTRSKSDGMNLTAMFPNHLATQRVAQGLSPEEVASRAGPEARVYDEMEAGRLLPERHEAERLSEAIGVDLPVLFNFGILNTIGDSRFWTDDADYRRFYDSMEEAARSSCFLTR
jgi:hypothetical protein